jgi:hypothetical protein
MGTHGGMGSEASTGTHRLDIPAPRVANVRLAILHLDELFRQLVHLGRDPAGRPAGESVSPALGERDRALGDVDLIGQRRAPRGRTKRLGIGAHCPDEVRALQPFVGDDPSLPVEGSREV